MGNREQCIFCGLFFGNSVFRNEQISRHEKTCDKNPENE